jgi:hypothetical protein
VRAGGQPQAYTLVYAHCSRVVRRLSSALEQLTQEAIHLVHANGAAFGSTNQSTKTVSNSAILPPSLRQSSCGTDKDRVTKNGKSQLNIEYFNFHYFSDKKHIGDNKQSLTELFQFWMGASNEFEHLRNRFDAIFTLETHVCCCAINGLGFCFFFSVIKYFL